MFYEEKLCIPAVYQEMVIMEHHNFMGHIGAQRLWNHMALQYAFAMPSEARKYNSSLSANVQHVKRALNHDPSKVHWGPQSYHPQS